MVDHKFPQLHKNATGVPHCQTHPNIIRFVAQVSQYIASISPFYHLYLIYPQHLPLSPHKSHETSKISLRSLPANGQQIPWTSSRPGASCPSAREERDTDRQHQWRNQVHVVSGSTWAMAAAKKLVAWHHGNFKAIFLGIWGNIVI